jgi:glycerol-3-phosphate dehydrogenase (NAD(P)+)
MTGDHKKPAVVIGGGSWGCAIAAALLQAGTPAQLLVRSPDTADALARGVCRQLSDAPVLPPLDARTEDSILDTAGLVFVVLPVSATANCLEQLAGRLAPDVPVALCAKGLMATADTAGMLMPELAGHFLPDHHAVVFSGPTFADEVASGKPAAITAASHNAQAANIIQQAFEGSALRVYASDDPIGVAIGGAMKNVIAIAAGCAAGLGLGDNARAAIITRGLAEMARFATALGANPGTIYGLSGAGDLALSCAGPHSRNMAFGLALGAGRTPDPVLAEGRHTVAAMVARGRASGIELPITEAVDKVVNQNHNLQDVVSGLLARRAGNE